MTIAIGFWTRPGGAFELDGHEVIEATAYKRLLALAAVPGTGPPEISGRALLGALIATGILAKPPCFDHAKPSGDCGATQRLDLPLQYWPTLRAGAPDLVLDRQIGQHGQCQHFMAHTDDALTPVDPRLGVPGGLATTAYQRCVRVAGLVFDGILRDPHLADWRIAGTVRPHPRARGLLLGRARQPNAALRDRPPPLLDADRLARLCLAWQVGLSGLHAPRGQRSARSTTTCAGTPTPGTGARVAIFTIPTPSRKSV